MALQWLTNFRRRSNNPGECRSRPIIDSFRASNRSGVRDCGQYSGTPSLPVDKLQRRQQTSSGANVTRTRRPSTRVSPLSPAYFDSRKLVRLHMPLPIITLLQHFLFSSSAFIHSHNVRLTVARRYRHE
jgi:hypothetical protein